MCQFNAIIGLAILIGAGCQSSTTHPNLADRSNPAIAEVLARKAGAGRSCARVLIDGERIASVHLHGLRYLGELQKIDTAACPEPFRRAWADYIAAWQGKLNREQANEETLDLISVWKGDLDELPASLRRIEAYDTEPAWKNCERVALDFGLDPAKVRTIAAGQAEGH